MKAETRSQGKRFAQKRPVTALIMGTVLMGLSGCATSPLQQKKLLDSLIGRSSLDVVRTFGVPSTTYHTQDHDFMAYLVTDTQYFPGSPDWGWGWGGYGYGGWGSPGPWGMGGIPPSYSTTSCQTMFELVQDHVISWSKRGDGC
ncbi:hypothetical protein PT277_07480 [Acetobacteraceae bacterium ESL0709]|nr:hypothetical protein [Acetobacteraceae bacterium ESL0697]MDF7678518.1 hypothetical protein [Acetobacteraceae bacterium ESL0709]